MTPLPQSRRNRAIERAAIARLAARKAKPEPVGFSVADRLMRRALFGGGGRRTSLLSVNWDVAGTGKLRCLSPSPRTLVGDNSIDGLHIVGDAERPRSYTDMLMRCRKCPHCLKLKAWEWTQRACTEMAASPRTWFGTLTLAPASHDLVRNQARVRMTKSACDFDELPQGEQFLERHAEISAWITNYVKRLRKAAGPDNFRLLFVTEAHKSGLPHYHTLLHENVSGSLSERLLRKQWPWGFSMFRLVEADIAGKAAWYVAKYLSKSTLSRVRASVDYGLERPDNRIGRLLGGEPKKRSMSIAPQSEGVNQDHKPFTPSFQNGGDYT